MKPRAESPSGQTDLFRLRLDQIINLDHPLVRLRGQIDWRFIETTCAAAYSDIAGQPPLGTQLMAGLAILKSTYDLSDEELCARWLENPYFQYFCGMEFFCHVLPFDRSSLTRWRQRMGEERMQVLLQESLSVAIKTKAMAPSDLTEVIVDTTVQEKAVMFPTDARLLERARARLVRLARRHGIVLRQSYVRVGKLALMKYQRYAHAKQMKRANRELRRLKTQLGRTIRDIDRKTKGRDDLNAVFRRELFNAGRVLAQKRGQTSAQNPAKIYSLHAPEVECIGKGKAHKPYEFGVKVSIATPIKRSAGGQFVVHAKAMPGNPYDGHTLKIVLPQIEALTGASVMRAIADAGYRGHKCPAPHDIRIFVAGQKRRVTEPIKRLMRRRSAIEPVIGHMKADHRMDRNYLKGAQGDAINAVLAAAGYNWRRLIEWLTLLLALILHTLSVRRAATHP